MSPSEREDPAHLDGAASLFHAGLIVWGKRGLEIRLMPAGTNSGGESDEWQKFPQEPGICY
eukprot:7782295-Lingulodinium_polyedra.AAC.1